MFDTTRYHAMADVLRQLLATRDALPVDRERDAGNRPLGTRRRG